MSSSNTYRVAQICQQFSKCAVGFRARQPKTILLLNRKSNQFSSFQPHASLNCALPVLSHTQIQKRYFSLKKNLSAKSAQFKLGDVTPRLAISYKCKVCGTQNVQSFSRKSYDEGIVIVQCEGCKSNHLIADNLGWFSHVEAR